MTPQARIQSLLDFIDASPSPWHVVNTVETLLQSCHFQKLEETCRWACRPGGRYYIVRDDSSIIVVVLGTAPLVETGFKIVGAHTDSPGFRVKPSPASSSEGLLKLGIEIYGGPILATFADRDLSLAGRLCLKSGQHQIERQLIKFDKPLLRLPNLAIHMNRTVNEEGLKFHKQNELPLIMSALSKEQLPTDYFLSLLQEHSGVNASQILSWDLAVYDTQKGAIWGAQQEFYSNSQLDNLASCHAALQALLDESLRNAENSLICALFDHEEIGSESKQGAAGSFLPDVLQRLVYASDYDNPQDFSRILSKSFLISADMAHGYHPNFPNAYDADQKVILNKGPAFKVNANQRYSSEGLSEAMFIDWCHQAEVPYQRYSHRCDLQCGSTIGPILSAKMGVRSVDVGSPMWAMHSIRESAGVYDHDYLIRVLKQFFISG